MSFLKFDMQQISYIRRHCNCNCKVTSAFTSTVTLNLTFDPNFDPNILAFANLPICRKLIQDNI